MKPIFSSNPNKRFRKRIADVKQMKVNRFKNSLSRIELIQFEAKYSM